MCYSLNMSDANNKFLAAGKDAIKRYAAIPGLPVPSDLTDDQIETLGSMVGPWGLRTAYYVWSALVKGDPVS